MSNLVVSEHIVQNVVGCGPFQIVLVFSMTMITRMSAVFSMFFMSFGNYNPGWRCLDTNDTTTDNNNNSSYEHSGGEVYIKDNCPLFTSCKNVQFSPETSTIVSEWGLLCDKAWIPSIIISIQMAGVLTGGSLAGYLADRFGRKRIYFGSQALLLIFNIISIFSSSWQMFAVCRYFLGIGIAFVFTLYFVYTGEFIPMKWRGPLSGAPFFPVKGILFGLLCMFLKHWKSLHIVSAVAAVIGLCPALWIPESLRWLEAKKHTEKYKKVVMQMAKKNDKELPPWIDRLTIQLGNDEYPKIDKTYNFSHLFQGVYKKFTLTLIFPWFSVSLIYYAISFGIKSLSGSFYINLIIFQVLEVPFSLIPMYGPNFLGRKVANVSCTCICGICLLVAAFLHNHTEANVQLFGVLIFVILGQLLMSSFWSMLTLHTTELYPTVIRGLCVSWGGIMARLGGVIAPFLIPKEEDSFFLCYILMGVFALIISVILTRLPETKGKELQNEFEPDEA